MNKTDYLNLLKSHLKGLAKEEIEDILFDYNEHFEVGLSKGKSDTEISNDLGDPVLIAKQFKADCLLENASEITNFRNVFKAVLAFISLSLFNLLIVFVPFLTLMIVITALWIVLISLVVVGCAGVIFSFLAPVLPFVVYSPSFSTTLFMIFSSIGVASTGLLGVLGMWYLTKWFLLLTVKYLKFNFNLISN
jgi:uncharacterized membrane protein